MAFDDDKIRIEVEGAQAAAQLEALAGEVQALEKELEDLNNTAGVTNAEIEGTTRRLEEAKGKFAEAGEQVQKFNDTQEEGGKKTQSLADKYVTLGLKVFGARQVLMAAGEAMRSVAQATGSYSGATKDAIDQTDNLLQSIASLDLIGASKALGRTYGDDVITGDLNLTVTVLEVGSSGASAATIALGPGHDPRRGYGEVKYTHSGTTVAYRAPGDVDFGTAVTYSTGVKVYSSNADKWATVTLTGTLSANGTTVFSAAFTSSTAEIEGIQRLVATGQTISSSGSNGDAIALATLDQLADLVTDTNGPKAYVMPSRTRRAVVALIRAAGGASSAPKRSRVPIGVLRSSRGHGPALLVAPLSRAGSGGISCTRTR